MILIEFFFSSEFNLHRGHQIERKNYIDDLKVGKWTSDEQPESRSPNPHWERRDGGSIPQYDRNFRQNRNNSGQWNDRRPRHRNHRWSNTDDDRNYRDHNNGMHV